MNYSELYRFVESERKAGRYTDILWEDTYRVYCTTPDGEVDVFDVDE